ncbi:MAG: branched-chain amino acid ABC transporter permease [Rhodospirillaceae bacterium]|nr:branched-chain amino acid ABC transporter permease [Rhodospirillaceae bacterium]
MAALIQTIYSGLVLGAIYALMAVGLTLIFGALRVLNLAHGALMMMGAYVSWLTAEWIGLPAFLGLPVSFITMMLVGFAIYKLLIGPMIGKPNWETNTFIATSGLALALESFALLVFGPRNQAQPFAIAGNFQFLGVTISYQNLVIMAVAAVALILMERFLTQTRSGLAIRATAQLPDAAQLMGIRQDHVFLLVLGLSSGLAALSGVLLSSIFFIAPTFGFHPMLKSFIICIFGGLGNIRGTLYAAFIIGITEALVSLYLGVRFALPVMFGLIIVVLIFRPTGLFGQREVVRL